jgi:anaerobic magnesium-protoporphyrin IX monomethyl ester cyclase
MKILLVWPAVTNAEFYNILPLGLGYLAANLPAEYQVKLWDGVLNHSSNNEILDEIEIFKPDIIGISVWNFNLNSAKEIVDTVKKKYPNIPKIIGGPTVSGYKNKIFDVIDADYAFIGECEKSFSDFLELFDKKDQAFTNVKGLIHKDEKGNAILNPPEWESIDNIKYCDYEFISLNKYIENGYYYGTHSKAKRIASILTTRGCPFGCDYCSAHLINGKKVRIRSVESVIAEIKELYEKYNITGFNIIDDNFTFNIGYAKQVCRKIIELNLKDASFNCPNGVRAEYIDQELLDLMRQSGWEWIFLAPESGSEKTLNNMHKTIKLTLIQTKIKQIKEAGLKVFGFFIIGYPGETLDDINKTIDFACKNSFDSVVFTCFQPLVGTTIYDKLIADGEIEMSPEGHDYYKISYVPTGLTVRQMKFIRFWGLFKFYTSSFDRFFDALSSHNLKRVLVFVIKIIK